MPPKKKKKSKATPGANGTARAAKLAAPASKRTPIELSRSKEKLPCPVDSETLQAKGDELDTGEVVSTRPATSDDLQVEIATRDSEAGDGAISKVFGGETFGLGDPDGGDAHAGASAP